jgi:hypothetical protein
MLKLSTDTMQNAIRRSKEIKPMVRVIADRTYSVTSSRNDRTYTVKFTVINGQKFGTCDCVAHGMCFHIASAAALNIALHSKRTN